MSINSIYHFHLYLEINLIIFITRNGPSNDFILSQLLVNVCLKEAIIVSCLKSRCVAQLTTRNVLLFTMFLSNSNQIFSGEGYYVPYERNYITINCLW